MPRAICSSTSRAACARSRLHLNKKSGVAGFARQHTGIDADLAQGLFIFHVGVLAENQLGIRRTVQPSVLLDFLLKLPRCPAGVTKRQDRAGWSVAARDGLEDVERSRQANPFIDR